MSPGCARRSPRWSRGLAGRRRKAGIIGGGGEAVQTSRDARGGSGEELEDRLDVERLGDDSDAEHHDINVEADQEDAIAVLLPETRVVSLGRISHERLSRRVTVVFLDEPRL